jgi:hypothetical protein
MNRSSSKASVTIAAIVVALGLVASTTAVNAFLMTAKPAYAAPAKDKVIVRNQGIEAYATWNDISVEVPDVGTVVLASIEVIESQAGTDLLVNLFTEEGNQASGFTTIAQDVLEVDNKLASATLSPVEIQVTIFDEFLNIIGTAEVTVQATWEGTGDILSQNTKNKIEFGEISGKFKGSTQGRAATAEGSIDNTDLGTTSNALLVVFKQMEMVVSESIVA